MAEDIQGYLAGCCSGFLTCRLHFALLCPYTISNYFQFPCPPLFNTPPKNCCGSPQSKLHFGGKESSVFISRRVYRCYCRAYFCEVSASLACLGKESIKNRPEQLFRFVFLLPADSRQAWCRSEQEGLYCCLLQALFSALNKTSPVCFPLIHMLEYFLARRPGCQKRLTSIFLQTLLFQPHRSPAASAYHDSACVSEASPSAVAQLRWWGHRPSKCGTSCFAVICGLGAGILGLVTADVRKHNASKLFWWEICFTASLLIFTVIRNTSVCLGMGAG